MITLKTISLENFLSHKDTVLEFEEKSKKLISGKSGAGKSSISESIVWALYGKGRVESRSLIKRGKKYAKVMVVLKDKEDVTYNITRSITSTGKHDLLVTYKEVTGKRFLPIKVSGIKNIQEYIEKQILHSSYILFINSVVCLQESENSFVSSTAARRKELILEIVNASDYDEYYEKAKNKVKELEITLGSSEIAITETTNKLKIDKENLSSLTELNKKLNTVTENEQNKKTELKKVLEKKSEKEILSSKISDKNKEFIVTHDKKESLELEVKEIDKKKNSFSLVDVSELKKEIEDKSSKVAKLKELTVKASKWQEEMIELIELSPVDNDYEEIEKRLNFQIINLMKKDVETCPEINKPCPIIVRERDSKVLELSNDLEEVRQKKKKYFEEKISYDKKINDLGEKPTVDNNELLQLESSIETLRTEIEQTEKGTIDMIMEISIKEKEIKLLEIKEKEINSEIGKIRLELDQLKTLYPEKKTLELETEYDALTSQKQNILQEIAVTENNITRIKEEEEELEKTKKNIKDDQETLKSLKLLKEAFGNNGIKAIVIDHVLPRLEDKINTILGKLSDFRVRLDTQRKGLNEDKMKEGLFIDIINDQGEVMDFESYSGGEKIKVSFSILMGLSSLCRIDFKILDETIVGLDSETINSFIEILNNDVFKEIKQVMMISHIPEIKDCFEDKIEIVKKDGTSVIEK